MTANLGDLEFFLKTACLSPELRGAAEALAQEAGAQPRTFARRYAALQEQWRVEQYWRRVDLPRARLTRRLMRARSRRQAPLANFAFGANAGTDERG